MAKKDSKQTDFLDFDEPTKKVQTKPSVKKQENLFDMDLPTEPVKKEAPKQQSIFDLLGDAPSTQPTVPVQQPINMNIDLFQIQPGQQQVQTKNSGNAPTLGTFDDLLMTSSYQGLPQPTGNGITLNVNDFSTEAVTYLYYPRILKIIPINQSWTDSTISQISILRNDDRNA